jgi:signal peptidase II
MRRMIRENKQLLSVALSLILGGALGNFIDRLLTGEVVDFFQFWFRFSIFNWDVNYIFPIFNVADSAIVIGVALIFIDAYRSWLRERKEGINEAHGS